MRVLMVLMLLLVLTVLLLLLLMLMVMVVMKVVVKRGLMAHTCLMTMQMIRFMVVARMLCE